MFEKALRKKFRYNTVVGNLTTEDLWSLKLTQLNELAKSLNKELKEAEEESFIETRSASNTELSLKFDIVKHIISVLLQEKKDAADSKKKKEQKDQLLAILHRKQNESLENKSEAEILAMIEAL